MRRIAICIPSYGEMKMLSVCSLVMATNLLRTMGHDLTLHVRTGPYTHWNRENLYEDALNAGADSLMFIDTDIVFETDAIATLISREKDIIGGAYNLKTDRETISTVKLWNEDRSAFRDAADQQMPSEPFKVAALGTGFLLIDMDVFKAMEWPYFPCEFDKMGEDVAFCVNAQKAGFDVWCDPAVALQHIGDKAY